jgi:hypothetical protein
MVNCYFALPLVCSLDLVSYTADDVFYLGKLLIIMSMNLFAIWVYDYFVVNGVRHHLAAKQRARPKNTFSKGDKEIPEQSMGDADN